VTVDTHCWPSYLRARAPARFRGRPDDESDDILRQVGSIYRVHVRGQGIAAHDTGSITLNPDGSVVIHGPHEVFVEGDALLCEVLG
jgi:hypothetical protein